jgi:hypothetical protein
MRADPTKWAQLAFRIALCLTTVLSPVFAQDSNSEAFTDPQETVSPIPEFAFWDFGASEMDVRYGNYIRLILDEAVMSEFFQKQPEYFNLVIPKSPTERILVRMYQKAVASEHFQLTASHGRGEPVAVPYEPGLTYSGWVLGRTDRSLGAITFTLAGIRGVLSFDNANWVIGPAGDQMGNSSYIFYSDRELVLPVPLGCGTPDDDPEGRPASSGDPGHSARDAGDCIDMYFDCDYDMYQNFNSSVVQTADYVFALFNVVSLLYSNETVNVSLYGINVFTSADGFREGSSDNALADYEAYHGSSHPGDLAQLLAMDNNNNGGLASNIGNFCNVNNSYSYSEISGIFQSYPTYSWDAYLVTHELGHVLGSHHTHWCGWSGGAIDNCFCPEGSCSSGPDPGSGGGTIMSYCHLSGTSSGGCTIPGAPNPGIPLSNGFGSQPRNAILNEIAGAGCSSPCSCPTNLFFPVVPGYPVVFWDIKHECSNVIISEISIPSGYYQIYDAGAEIFLNPGFHATAGATFHAYIDGCGGLRLGNEDGDPEADTEMLVDLSFKAYPNPFSNSTTLEYTLIAESEVFLEVRNSLGQRVALLENGAFRLPGFYSLTFDASGLPAGLYFATLKAGNKTKSTKLVLSQ